MLNLLKKDILTISKARSEVLILLVMPFVLIAILGLSLGGLMTGSAEIEPIHLAIVDNTTERDGGMTILTDQGLPDEQATAIIENLKVNRQIMTVIDTLEKEQLLVAEKMTTEAANEALNHADVEGVLTIPDALTTQVLTVMNGGEATESLMLEVIDETTIQSQVLRQIFRRFTSEYNLMMSIQTIKGDTLVVPGDLPLGETKTIETTTEVSAFQYFTIGMAMMFSLYVASSISSNAFIEKKQDVLLRMMLAGEKPVRYLLSKVVSGYVLAVMQLGILFGLSQLLFDTFSDRSSEFWLTIIAVTFVYATVIGALTALLTSLTLMMPTDSVSGIFSGLVVTVFAFLGGSFTPVEQISPFIRTLGNWTPNGAMMTVYLQQIQGYSMTDSMPLLMRILLLSAILFIVAWGLFPKRRFS
ncbi:hypothetical protein HMI01_16050 [Halolactibacillus miurensis]|uniref:ABC-2 type transport system permease protein n=1 Tax=Halolactibacillus miurensis TaxID=306541 RepID=A0A1I6TDZ6_9BACI|nr:MULTISPECIES: ABC transporter permease [Halolactibacillus]GEM04617.1 hypothetical protein HMI01_16050 [Halolactibacillus miurensis]SFS87406.1 ABC-2 type transport system permease protein [Halolactibacillus miurensis]